MPDTVTCLDAIDPQQAVPACGAKSARLAELPPVGVRVPQGFARESVDSASGPAGRPDAYRRHCATMGLDEVIDVAPGRLGSDAEAAGIQTAAQAVLAERPAGRWAPTWPD